MSTHRFESFARAAMLGLLAVTQSACSDAADQSTEGTGGAGSLGGSAASGGSATESGGSASEGGTGGSTSESGGSANEGGAGGDGKVGVLSSKTIVDLSLDEFSEMCDEAGGIVEIHAHCGHVVTGKGFSYDSDIDVFTEHTCRGYNTCTGFSCVIDD